jgi:hypothetical protein
MESGYKNMAVLEFKKCEGSSRSRFCVATEDEHVRTGGDM